MAIAEVGGASLPIDGVVALIPAIYETLYLQRCTGPDKNVLEALQGGPKSQLSMIEFARDTLIRRYGMKSLAMKHLRGMVNAIGESNKRDLFAGRGNDKVAAQRARLVLFARLAGIHGEDEEDESPAVAAVKLQRRLNFFVKLATNLFPTCKAMANMLILSQTGSWSNGIDRDNFVTVLYKLFPNLITLDVYKKQLDKEVNDLDTRTKDHQVLVHFEMASLVMINFVETEQELATTLVKQHEAAKMFQRLFRRRKQRLKEDAPHIARWETWFDRCDKYLHHLSQHGVFEFAEFSWMINAARADAGELMEFTIMKIFNEWQDKLDPSLSDTSFLTKPEATEDSQIKKEYAANRIQHVFHRYMTQKGRLEEAMLMMQASHSLITTVSRRKLR